MSINTYLSIDLTENLNHPNELELNSYVCSTVTSSFFFSVFFILYFILLRSSYYSYIILLLFFENIITLKNKKYER